MRKNKGTSNFLKEARSTWYTDLGIFNTPNLNNIANAIPKSDIQTVIQKALLIKRVRDYYDEFIDNMLNENVSTSNNVWNHESNVSNESNVSSVSNESNFSREEIRKQIEIGEKRKKLQDAKREYIEKKDTIINKLDEHISIFATTHKLNPITHDKSQLRKMIDTRTNLANINEVIRDCITKLHEAITEYESHNELQDQLPSEYKIDPIDTTYDTKQLKGYEGRYKDNKEIVDEYGRQISTISKIQRNIQSNRRREINSSRDNPIGDLNIDYVLIINRLSEIKTIEEINKDIKSNIEKSNELRKRFNDIIKKLNPTEYTLLNEHDTILADKLYALLVVKEAYTVFKKYIDEGFLGESELSQEVNRYIRDYPSIKEQLPVAIQTIMDDLLSKVKGMIQKKTDQAKANQNRQYNKTTQIREKLVKLKNNIMNKDPNAIQQYEKLVKEYSNIPNNPKGYEFNLVTIDNIIKQVDENRRKKSEAEAKEKQKAN